MGDFFNLLIVIYLWYTTCFSLRDYINIIHIHLLRATPSLVLCIFTIIPIYYLAWYGIKYIARFSITIYLSLTFACLLLFLVFKDLRFNFLMPIAQSSIKGIKDSFSPCVFTLLGYEVISIIYPEITNKKKAMKYVIGANLITTIFCIILVVVVTSFFGEEMLKKSMYPTITLARSYRAPIIERMDVLFLAVWLPVVAMTISGYYAVTYYSINKLLNLKKKGVYLFMFTAITIYISNIPKSLSQNNKYSDVIFISGTAFSIFLLVCYAFSFIRKRGVKPLV